MIRMRRLLSATMPVCIGAADAAAGYVLFDLDPRQKLRREYHQTLVLWWRAAVETLLHPRKCPYQKAGHTFAEIRPVDSIEAETYRATTWQRHDLLTSRLLSPAF